MNCIIFDIDGVVCNSIERYHKHVDDLAKENGDIQKYIASFAQYSHGDYNLDQLIPMGKDLLDWAKSFYKPDLTVFITAREEEGRKQTENWLEKHQMFDQQTLVIMKPNYIRDMNGHYIISSEFNDVNYKRAAAKLLAKKYNVLMAVDDKLHLCEMYRDLGFQTIHLMCVVMP